MAQNDVVRARIDGALKEQASVVLESMGLTLSDAFRMLITRVVAEKSLPFEPLQPTEATLAAIQAARQGKTVRVGHPSGLLDSLNA